jgi:hypothetical protein
MIARKDFTQQISKNDAIGGLRTKNYSNDALPEVLKSNFSQDCCRYPSLVSSVSNSPMTRKR